MTIEMKEADALGPDLQSYPTAFPISSDVVIPDDFALTIAPAGMFGLPKIEDQPFVLVATFYGGEGDVTLIMPLQSAHTMSSVMRQQLNLFVEMTRRMNGGTE